MPFILSCFSWPVLPAFFAAISMPSVTPSTCPGSNGQAEGQINRLKTIKRAMYGRAGAELLRPRLAANRQLDFLSNNLAAFFTRAKCPSGSQSITGVIGYAPAKTPYIGPIQ